MVHRAARIFVAWIVTLVGSTRANPPHEQHDYCILGAGPGGLQVGHLMLKRGWDYITLERNARPGSFFESYPVHRQLISLNKRYTGRQSKEFNLRHDWNSLLETVSLLCTLLIFEPALLRRHGRVWQTHLAFVEMSAHCLLRALLWTNRNPP